MAIIIPITATRGVRLASLCILVPLLIAAPFLLVVFLSNENLTSTQNSKHGGDLDAEANIYMDDNNHLEMVTHDHLDIGKFQAPPAPTPPPPPPTPFDYYILELEWPTSICTQQRHATCNLPVPKRFTIHGLWPSNIIKPDPINCNPGEKFDYTQVISLDKRPDFPLTTKWPSLFKSTTNMQFWSDEWAKHGTCSGLSQLEYFRRALFLYDKIDVYTKLSGINVTPGHTYDPSTMITDYDNKYKVQPKIKCVDRTSSPHVEMMAQVQFRVEKNGAVVSITTGTNMCTTTPVEYP